MWFWSFDVFRRVVVFWAGLMYTGQLLKDILRLPRPPHHLIVYPLERHYAEEYGMPSTRKSREDGMRSEAELLQNYPTPPLQMP